MNGLTQRWSVSTTPGGEDACSRQTAPVVAGSRLFLTAASGVGAYDASTGVKLWAYTLTNAVDSRPPQLAVDQQTLIVYAMPCRAPAGTGNQPGPLNPPPLTGELIALDTASGAVRWPHQAPASSAGIIVSRGVTVVSGTTPTDMRVSAYATTAGKPLWERLGIIAHQPVAGGIIVLGRPYNGGTLAVDISTGRVAWETERNWVAEAADPSGRYFIVDERDNVTMPPGQNPPMRLLKVRADTGRVVWQHDELTGLLAVDNATIYATSTRHSFQTLVAVDLNTGSTLWHRHLGQVEPSVAGGVLWGNFGAPDGTRKIRALDPQTGTDLPLPAAVRGAAGFGRPVIAHGWLYLTDFSTLRAFTVPHDG